jgi:hypothetical protein
MDDAFYQNVNVQVVDTIREALTNFQNFKLGTPQVSSYGIFRQSKMGANYDAAFRFINAGKDVWKNIFHMEWTIIDSSISSYTKLLAINCISDNSKMVQDITRAEYAWKSISLQYLKVPELILAKILRKVYDDQINGHNLNMQEWKENVKEELDRVFNQLFDKETNGVEQYMPLCYYPEPEEKPQGFFAKLFGGGRQDAMEEYPKIIYDDTSIAMLLADLYGDVELNEEKYREIMSSIISSATAIDSNPNNIEHSIHSFLDQMLSDLKHQYENAKTQDKLAADNKYDAESHVRERFSRQKDILLLEKKIALVEALEERLSKGGFLHQLIQEICKKNREVTNQLDELSKNEYGGTMQQVEVDMKGVPVFKVNQSIKEILSGINNNWLFGIINDKNVIYTSLQQFLTHSMSAKGIDEKHNLGEVNSDYTTLDAVRAVLLVTPEQENDGKLQPLTSQFANLCLDANSLYRENTFYLISSREYFSDKYIIRYKRG